jgi:GTP cyclohydrolase II
MAITNSTKLQLEYGEYKVSYHLTGTDEVVSFMYGDMSKKVPLVRLQSACLFGETFLSKHCDCRDQLLNSLKYITENESGVLVYAYQEGRGIGLDRKIQAMELQRTEKLDTVEAFRRLGFPPDLRDYDGMIEALKDLDTPRVISLISNNPVKIEAVKRAVYKL